MLLPHPTSLTCAINLDYITRTSALRRVQSLHSDNVTKRRGRRYWLFHLLQKRIVRLFERRQITTIRLPCWPSNYHASEQTGDALLSRHRDPLVISRTPAPQRAPTSSLSTQKPFLLSVHFGAKLQRALDEAPCNNALATISSSCDLTTSPALTRFD